MIKFENFSEGFIKLDLIVKFRILCIKLILFHPPFDIFFWNFILKAYFNLVNFAV